MKLNLKIKPFSFNLLKELKTFHGVINKKNGWLIRIEDEIGNIGWGEIAPLCNSEKKLCEKVIKGLGTSLTRFTLEKTLQDWPGSVRFGIGSALAEIDYCSSTVPFTNWLKATSSCILLPTDNSILKFLDKIIQKNQTSTYNLTVKWKVAKQSNKSELYLLKQILSLLPQNTNLRIDANGGWKRYQAEEWVQELHNEPRLEWLEQPLPANDIDGLTKLAQHIPIALDESLTYDPTLRKSWNSWQIRRPLIEGDPRELLNELINNNSYRVISTAFETGIGRRWVEHLAAIQQKSNTPTQPGLAPGWCPNNQLFCDNPQLVWEAA